MMYPELGQQPAKSNTGLWLAIGGGVLALLLFCCAGGIITYFTVIRDMNADTPPSPSAHLSETEKCLVGSWTFSPADAERSVHGGPALFWRYDKGETVLTFSPDGTARVENTRETVAVDSTGDRYRNRSSGAATFTYRVSGADISYGPVASTGKSYLYINDVLQGEPEDRKFWDPSPEKVRCLGPSLELSGEAEGTPYVQEFSRKV